MRLPKIHYYARAIDIAYCAFYITDDKNEIFCQSREIESIERVSVGWYGIKLKHPLSFYKSEEPEPGIFYGQISHQRAHVQPMMTLYEQKQIVTQVQGLAEPYPGWENTILVTSYQLNTAAQPPIWELYDAPLLVDIFDCENPAKRYYTAPIETLRKAAIAKLDYCNTIRNRLKDKLNIK